MDMPRYYLRYAWMIILTMLMAMMFLYPSTKLYRRECYLNETWKTGYLLIATIRLFVQKWYEVRVHCKSVGGSSTFNILTCGNPSQTYLKTNARAEEKIVAFQVP